MTEHIDQTAEEQRPSRQKYVWTYAIISAMIFIILLLITHMFRDKLMEQNNLMSLIYFIVLIIVILMAQLKIRSAVYGGAITFSQSFGSGMLVGIFSALMYAVFVFIFYQFIAPGVIDEMITMAEQKMREDGQSEEMIETAMKYTKWFLTPIGIFVGTIFMHSLMTLVASLITSMFVQRKR